MRNNKSTSFKIIQIAIAVCVLGLVTFGLFYIFTNGNIDSPDNIRPSPLGSEATPNDESPEPLENGEDEAPPIEEQYINVRMSLLDISRGNLILVNHNHAYTIPTDLDPVLVEDAKNVPYTVLLRQNNPPKLLQSIIAPLDDMMQGFIDETGENIIAVISAFRDEEQQQRMLNDYIAQDGMEAALRRVALPGHSEHHTGLAVDFVAMIDGVQHSFTDLEITDWFMDNSYRYGFTFRFPEDKTEITGSMYEPWHYRYVGIPHSVIMHQRKWVLEEYIDALRGYTFEAPLSFQHDGVSYEIFFTESTDISIPMDTRHEISGNNVDGFIVTLIK